MILPTDVHDIPGEGSVAAILRDAPV